MIKAFILYFLSLKPTHGYEIQKYIQLNQMDMWTKIQSGSIYYALNKLEKEGLIDISREEVIGGKVRKVYEINENGLKSLENIMMEEIKAPIYKVESDKFISYPFLSTVDKSKMEVMIKNHISQLEEKIEDIKKWQLLKVGEETLGITKLSFEMMVSSLENQIKWHQCLIDELDKCIEESKIVSDLIKNLDFTDINDLNPVLEKGTTLDIKQIKKNILDNPDDAERILEQLINKIKK